MSKRLEKARKKTKALPNAIFGKGTDLKLKDLPCIKNKNEKVKKTYNLRESSVKALEKIADQTPLN